MPNDINDSEQYLHHAINFDSGTETTCSPYKTKSPRCRQLSSGEKLPYLDIRYLESPRFSAGSIGTSAESTYLHKFSANPHPFTGFQNTVIQKQKSHNFNGDSRRLCQLTGAGPITYPAIIWHKKFDKPKSGWRQFFKECWIRKLRI